MTGKIFISILESITLMSTNWQERKSINCWSWLFSGLAVFAGSAITEGELYGLDLRAFFNTTGGVTASGAVFSVICAGAVAEALRFEQLLQSVVHV